jgi:tetratricopeptide (TPR) repeat protein
MNRGISMLKIAVWGLMAILVLCAATIYLFSLLDSNKGTPLGEKESAIVVVAMDDKNKGTSKIEHKSHSEAAYGQEKALQNNIVEYKSMTLTEIETEEVQVEVMTIKKVIPVDVAQNMKAITLVKSAQIRLSADVARGNIYQGMKAFSEKISPIYENKYIYTKAMAYAYLTAGDCQESAKLYHDLSKEFPQEFAGHFGEALSYQICNRSNEALVAYKKTLELFPKGKGRYRYITTQISKLSNGVGGVT